MHNSAGWAHRSPVAVAQKVTRVTNKQLEIYPFIRVRLETLSRNLCDEATYTLKITQQIQKSARTASNYLHTSDVTLFSGEIVSIETVTSEELGDV